MALTKIAVQCNKIRSERTAPLANTPENPAAQSRPGFCGLTFIKPVELRCGVLLVLPRLICPGLHFPSAPPVSGVGRGAMWATDGHRALLPGGPGGGGGEEGIFLQKQRSPPVALLHF